uniref:Uncharacterized protein n=1 Tax=Daphnia magna TaxID=35525 RepID=A0A0P6D5M2_9CRUS
MLNGLGPPPLHLANSEFLFSVFLIHLYQHLTRRDRPTDLLCIRSRKKKKSNHFLTPGFHIQKISEKKRRKGPMTVCESASKMFLSASKGKKKRFPYRSYYAVIRSLWSA